MADYGYTSGGYKNGYETHSPRWGKTGYEHKDEGHHDHVCKPVIIDAFGRKKPIISYGPMAADHHTTGIVTKTEIIEEVHVPHVRYGNHSPTKVEHMKDHGDQNNRWRRPVSPSYDEADGFIGKNHKTNPVSNPFWRSKSNGNHGSNYDHGSHGWNKHSGNTMRDPYFNGYQGKHQMEHDSSHEPAIITTGGWARPSHLGWAIPPNHENPLTKPTNNIDTAIDYLKNTAKHTPASMAPAKPWSAVPTPVVPTIDSSEARRRYANISESPQTVKTVDAYSSAIDSREAVRRYGAQLM